ncbi:MAG: homoserine O-acetyltransferase [Bacteroidetes bacterium]|nr:homoserine O-acetyltransferase [Bacteroidota bacterium]
MIVKKFKSKQKFFLESGEYLPEIEIAYHTFGELNAKKNNVVWVVHALTANSNVFEWWPDLFGESGYFNPKKHFIICANNLGSCYGTTGPLSVNPFTNYPYFSLFPAITIRDMVHAHELLRLHLNINEINTIIGGSQGAQQVLEWNILKPQLFKTSIVIAANAKHSAWGIAFNESQRLAIKADRTYYANIENGGEKGLSAARSIALLSYRSYETYVKTQTENRKFLLQSHKAAEYQRYQGEKLVKRFNAYAYVTLTNAMDSHNVGRNKDDCKAALSVIKNKTLIIGIKSDILFPTQEQEKLHELISSSTLNIIESEYGHDGFLIETKKIKSVIRQFSQSKTKHLAQV